MKLFNEGVQIIEVATIGKWTGQCAVENSYFAIQSSPFHLFSLDSHFPVIPSLTTKHRPVPLILYVILERAVSKRK